MEQREFQVGEHQVMVVYVPRDDGPDVDPFKIHDAIARYAAVRANAGWRLATITSMPLRHTGTTLGGIFGSGIATKVAVTIVYTDE